MKEWLSDTVVDKATVSDNRSLSFAHRWVKKRIIQLQQELARRVSVTTISTIPSSVGLIFEYYTADTAEGLSLNANSGTWLQVGKRCLVEHKSCHKQWRNLWPWGFFKPKFAKGGSYKILKGASSREAILARGRPEPGAKVTPLFNS